jgi:LacI family transcriptional regulator
LANIKDVAKLANVSVATVSRVINNKGYVNEHTKELVMQAIKELNYVPNEIARSLYRKSSKIIGIIIPDLKNEFFNDMISGIEEVILQHGYKTMLCTSRESLDREKEYLQIFSTNTISQVKDLMLGVIEDEQGTGKTYRLDNDVRMIGKTGTGQVVENGGYSTTL